MSGYREPNVVVDIGYGDREYWAFTNEYMSGMSAFAIQKMMRHKNINVMMRYVAMCGNELKEQNDGCKSLI